MKSIEIFEAATKAVAPTPLESPSKDIKSTSDESVKSPAFNAKLTKIATILGVDKSDLFRIMAFESGLNPAAGPNKVGAVGLIQFIPRTAIALGTTTSELQKMSAVKQLDYVLKFYQHNNLPAGADLPTMYLMTYMPAAVQMNKPDNFVLGIDPNSTQWNNADKFGHPFPSDKHVTRANNWVSNPSFRPAPPRDYFTVGDVKKYIQDYRHK